MGALTEAENTKITQAGASGGLEGEYAARREVLFSRLQSDGGGEACLELVYAGTLSPTEQAVLDRWQIKLPEQVVSARDVLKDMAYFGDRSRCKMDAGMAQAYADAISSLPAREGESLLYATLADPADDGMPILITTYLNKDVDDAALAECPDARYGEIGFVTTVDGSFVEPIAFWQYGGGSAQRLDIATTNYSTGFGTINGQSAYRYIQFYHDVGHNVRAQYYVIQNGRMSLAHTVEFLEIVKEPTDGGVKLYGEVPDGVGYRPDDEQALRANGWVEDDFSWRLVLDNGENISQEVDPMTWSHDQVACFEETDELAHISDIEYHYMLDSTQAEEAVALLHAYADAVNHPDNLFS